VLPELNDPDVRQLIFRGYRIIYDIREEMVRLLGIRHGSANLARELRRGLWGDI